MKYYLKILAISTLIAASISHSVFAQITTKDDLGSSPPPLGPSLSQLGGTTAYVPMKRSNCEGVVDCGIHVLATKSGNLDIKFKLGMTCPAGRQITYLAYQPQGQSTRVVFNGNTNFQNYSGTVTMQPFSLEELEKAGQTALGGAWPKPGPSNNKTKTVKKTLKKSIDVWGQCSGLARQQKTFPVTVTATFDDKDFPSQRVR
ncbi:hypothetical protein [Calothrix sp. UHCC 0171]|uniref:hypothetical protein n=1 Tax=Calothrix sp. UHCC 0171 TaxID=3110245 RepID=UPI002B1F8B45|nr:hypothetical protein [Calothrix sp. UHCC 0171]MEA5572500.1 hypothetical protein [Calothrix sp. UHCC 0171]